MKHIRSAQQSFRQITCGKLSLLIWDNIMGPRMGEGSYMQHAEFVISFISLRLGSSDAVALTAPCVIDLCRFSIHGKRVN